MYRLLLPYKGQAKRVLWTCVAALLWAIWNIRNKFTIERKFPNQPTDGLYKMSIYLQAWRLVARRQDKEALELAIGRIRMLHSTLREPRDT